ncbi:hypothetical protein [Ferruginivarius sediminum]|uniref:Uncharacterized protein n=1 Tax=Ferruginivarius sediminum TaxID=2661937 RepID=A0A369T9L2_9PROT|nr:hypothetical protein [Ferruginivarius sediminum]RDD62003.1 hypothetical protein DRB17_09125 [Ferruginivarius sediminum]
MIAREWDIALSDPRCLTIRQWQRLGVEPGVAFLRAGAVGVMDVEARPDGTWTPAEAGAGQPMFVMPVLVREGDPSTIVDLLAFHHRRPDRFYLRHGAATVAGEWALHDARSAVAWEQDRPLYLFSNPLAWLQAGCDGAVLLDSDGLDELRDCGRVVANSLALADWLDRRLRQPQMVPRLEVPDEARAAA